MPKKLKYIVNLNGTEIYSINDTKNYVISNHDTCELLSRPEIVGYDIKLKMLSPISDFLKYFCKEFYIENVHIVNILRGGLNFPIEEACYKCKVNVSGTSFLSSERVFDNERISQIVSNYKKILKISDSTIIIGDIIATGETIRNAVNNIKKNYKEYNKSIKRIIFFTIGTISAIKAIKKMEEELFECWDDFEGIHLAFIEGVFTTYSSSGLTELNLPNVDFRVSEGIISPNYRSQLLNEEYTLFEKCTIYDGGSRRFEQHHHIDTILNYWFCLSVLKHHIGIPDFFAEKMGYCVLDEFFDWVHINGYEELDKTAMYSLYIKEKQFFEKLIKTDCKSIATKRYQMLLSYYNKEAI